MDTVSREQRSEIMAKVPSIHTTPEIRVRSALHGAGYRFRLHAKELPGNPDIVFRGRKKVIFVHGCFWHQHIGCPHFRFPSSNVAYWELKLGRNVERDKTVRKLLRKLGYRTLVIWECETKQTERLLKKLHRFLDFD